MRWQEMHEILHRTPFDPFVIQLSNGQSYTVRHPEFAALTRTSVFVGLPPGRKDVPDRMVQCDLLHVVSIEPANGARPRSQRRR